MRNNELIGAAGVDPNWTVEEWTLVLKQALDERDEARAVAHILRRAVHQAPWTVKKWDTLIAILVDEGHTWLGEDPAP